MCGLIIGEGRLPTALVTVVRGIVGADADALQPLSMEGLSREQLTAAALAAIGGAPAILFTDLPGGTCAVVARRVAQGRTGTGIVSGVNLPMLLDFVFNRTLPLDALTTRLVEKGRRGIVGECT
jgi:mannose/fructose-specific phosphotransferase system component IIA